MSERRRRLKRWENLKKLTTKNITKAGLTIVIIFVLTAILAPWIAPYDPYEQDFSIRLKPPSFKHPLGTDEFGRDILSRVLYGSRPTLVIIVSAALIGLIIGGGPGIISGYYGGM